MTLVVHLTVALVGQKVLDLVPLLEVDGLEVQVLVRVALND